MPVSPESRPELPIALRLLACSLLAAATAFAAYQLDFKQPFVGYGMGGAFLLFITLRPGSRQVLIVIAAAALIAAGVLRGHVEGAATLVVQLLGALGLSTLFFLACKLAWEPRERRSGTLRVLLPAAVLTFLVFGSVYSLNMASWLHAKTFDLYTFVFDGSLGFQPSFELGRVLLRQTWLFPLVKVTYEAIVLAMAVFYAAFMRRRDKPMWELIEVLFASAMVGYLFFSVFPVTGPRYALANYFPGTYPPYEFLHRVRMERIPVSWLIPRNGVPSLHMTWALLIWWNTRSLPRWARAVAAIFALITAFDTLATGEHYLFDLIVALPFSLWMQASMVRTVPVRDRKRWLPALCGCVVFLAWLVIGRFGLPWMLSSKLVPWSLVIASSAGSLAWAMRLPALVPELEIPLAAESRAVAATV